MNSIHEFVEVVIHVKFQEPCLENKLFKGRRLLIHTISITYQLFMSLQVPSLNSLSFAGNMKKIVIFGSTGMTGLCAVEAAVKKGISYCQIKSE